MRFLLAMIILPMATAWSQSRPNRPARPATKKSAPARPAKKPAKTAAKSPRAARPVPANLVVDDISVQGQRKIEKDAILARIKTRKGDAFSDADLRADVLSLFSLGYFNDIQVERKISGGAVDLVYRVVEKPSIAEIVYEGTSEVKSEEVAEASGLKQYEILNMQKVREAQEKIQKLYEDKGFFLAKVESQVTEVKAEESVKLTFKIAEGEKVKVKKIVFIGTDKVSDETLKGRLYTQEEGYFSFISGSGGYKQEAFERDIQMIRATYYNLGYIQAKVDRPQISVTPDKTGIYLTVRVEEGAQYNVGEVDFAGDLLFPRPELFEAIKIDENGVFAYDVLQRDLAELQAKYGDLGYAYTNVIPRWEIREQDRKVNLVFEIDKGNKVYFGRIDMTGNSKTRDKVIRREMKIREGELYNETRRRESMENIQRLGFFDEVNFKTSTPPDALDVMNVEVVVKERNTGQVQVSAGYGTSTGFTFGGSVQQTNFLGKGQNLGVSMQLTGTTSMYDLSFTEPYFQDSLWSVGGRVFQTSNNSRIDYDEKRTGGSVSLGHPVTENTRAYLSYSYTAAQLSPVWTTDSSGNSVLLTDYAVFPLDTASGDASTIEAALAYDTRNDRFLPTKGWYARAGVSNTGLFGGNMKYYSVSGDVRFFRTLFWDVVWRNSLQYAKIGSVDNDKTPPFNELYLLGGPYSLRGYRFGRVGRMVYSQKAYDNWLANHPGDTTRAELEAMRFFGGQQKAQFQTELQFPMIREAKMYGVVFYDIGQAEDQLSADALFADWGFGLRWFSPIGPLRFEWGFPLNRNPIYHENGVFEFSIGTPF